MHALMNFYLGNGNFEDVCKQLNDDYRYRRIQMEVAVRMGTTHTSGPWPICPTLSNMDLES